MKISVAIVALALVSSGFTGTQQVNLRAGQYEVTTEVSMGKGMPPITSKNTDCVTVEDTKDFMKAMLREMGEQAAQCKISDVKSSQDKMTFTLSCKIGSDVMITTNDLSFNGDSFTNVANSKMKDGPVSMKQSGKRVGDCK